MALSNNEKRLFIHVDLLNSAKGKEALQDYFHKNPSISNYLIFKGLTEDGKLDTKDGPYSFQDCTLDECRFGHLVAQAAINGYVFASYQSFIQLVGYPH